MECKATLAISKPKLRQGRGSEKIRPCGSRSTGAHTSRVRNLMARHRSSYADRMTLWHALTHIAAHRPQTATSCPVWHAHHPLPVTYGPLQIAPITLHSSYWLKAPQLPAKSPHCIVR